MIVCDISTGIQHPYIPKQYHQTTFDPLHSISHLGIQATQQLITRRYVWPWNNMNVRKWAHFCLIVNELRCTVKLPLLLPHSPHQIPVSIIFTLILLVTCSPRLFVYFFTFIN